MIPSDVELEVVFISGVTDTGKVAPTAFGTWERSPFPSIPATYNSTNSTEAKWGGPTFGSSGGTVTYWFDATSDWTSVEKDGFLACLALWSAEANLSFTLASSADAADQTFFRSNGKTAYQIFTPTPQSNIGSDVAGKAVNSQIHIDTSQRYWHVGTSFEDAGGYGWQTVVHEIGHMLGLGHGGPYNGKVDASTQQFSAYDTRLWTLMSYIDPTATAKFTATYPVTDTAWGTAQGPNGGAYGPTTPMILDILAIQRVYGAPTTGPLAAGGQVFGFNSNIDGPVKQFFDFTVNQHPVITIWDGGINNTLDLSGFSRPSTVNLNAGTFSSANGMKNNIAIAMNSVIEKAIGGTGNDQFTGSSADNVFIGKGGDDTIDGGAGTDTGIFAGLRSQYTLTALNDNGVKVVGPDGTDILRSVERLTFDDQSVDWPLGGNTGDNVANALTDQSLPFGQVPLGGSAVGSFESAADRDWYAVELTAGTAYTIDLTAVQQGDSALAHPLIRLHNSTGAVVAGNDDAIPGANPDSQMAYVPTETGTYYIEASAFGGNLTGTYAILLSSLLSKTDDFANGLTDTAHPLGLLTVGGSDPGNLETPTDRDWFRVELTSGETYVLTLTGASDGDARLADPYLRLHNHTGTVVGENDDIVGGASLASELVFEATETGFYYIEAGSYQDRYAGNYVVGVLAATGADDFADSLASPFHPLGLVDVGGAMTGRLETAADRDWVAVQFTAGTTYHVSLTGAEGGGGSLEDPYVTLHDAAGHALAANDDIELGVNLDAALDFVASEGGTYYVEAASFNDLYLGTYTVAVTASKTIDDLITGLYAGYCNRAPDAEGEAYWVQQLQSGMGLAQIAQSFAEQPEIKGVYGFLASSSAADDAAFRSFIADIYVNLLNRPPDAAGESYWTEQLKSGAVPAGMAVLDILRGARGDDVLVVENKVAAGSYYVTQTFNNQVPMTAESARNALGEVGFGAASLETAKAKVDMYVFAALYPDYLPVLGIAPNGEWEL